MWSVISAMRLHIHGVTRKPHLSTNTSVSKNECIKQKNWGSNYVLRTTSASIEPCLILMHQMPRLPLSIHITYTDMSLLWECIMNSVNIPHMEYAPYPTIQLKWTFRCHSILVRHAQLYLHFTIQCWFQLVATYKLFSIQATGAKMLIHYVGG
jgi:hypothetical protein